VEFVFPPFCLAAAVMLELLKLFQEEGNRTNVHPSQMFRILKLSFKYNVNC